MSWRPRCRMPSAFRRRTTSFACDPDQASAPGFLETLAPAEACGGGRRDLCGRTAIEPALSQIDAEVEQDAMLILLLDHFGDRADAEALAGGQHAFNDRALAHGIVDVADVDAVDLHEIDVQLLQIGEG